MPEIDNALLPPLDANDDALRQFTGVSLPGPVAAGNGLLPGYLTPEQKARIAAIPKTGPNAGILPAAGSTVGGLPVQPVVNAQTIASSPGLANISDAGVRQFVLNRIASGEAPGYNVSYTPPGSGPLKTFSDFSRHPQIRSVIPGSGGKTSDAAGRYQFLSSTFGPIAQKLGLKDFSPASQDAAAWWLAQDTYQRATGRSIVDDAKKGRVDWGALGDQWESLKRGGGGQAVAGPSTHAMYGAPEGASSTTIQPSSSPAASPLGGEQAAGEGLPLATPQSASLGQWQLMALLKKIAPDYQAHPVDYDPWKYVAKLGGGMNA